MTDASRSAGAAPSLDDQISEVEEEIDVIEGAICRLVERQVPPTESTKHRNMLHAILASLRELAALRVSDEPYNHVPPKVVGSVEVAQPVAEGEVADLVLRLHRYHHAMREEKGHREGAKLMVGAAALLERLARERDEWKACRFKDVALANRRIAALEEDARKWAWYRKRHGQMPGEETADEWADEQMALEEKQRAWLASRAGPEPRE